ncbi:hypothetical protein [Yinghuangia sp. YIM S09857]|uniref:hypothetical protein n=1 Tax=Yinghuangia sp. YIM S09857 TaxID=3436929 RepID=UPI003F53CA9A
MTARSAGPEWTAAMRALAARCGRAPSAHNTQPWQVRYEDAGVGVYWDPARALPVSDPTGRDLFLGLGAYLETCLVVAAGVGLGADLVVDVDRAARRVAWLVPAEAPYATGFAPDDVEARRSGRGPYAPGLLPDDVLTEAGGLVEDAGGIRHVPVRTLAPLLTRADRWMFAAPELTAELRDWLRLRPSHPRYTQDGLTDQALGLSRAEAAGLGAALRPRVYGAFRRVGLPAALAASSRGLLRGEGSALVLVGPADAGPADLVALGRALMRCWLALGARGLATHPLSQILDCPATEAELAALLDLAAHERAVAVFRVGRPVAAPPRSARRTG